MLGKLSSKDLQKLVLDQLKFESSDVIIGSALGEDFAAIRSNDEILYITMDPITACTKNLGKLLVRVNANDIACSGKYASAMMVTLLMPAGTSKEDLQYIMQEISKEAKKSEISILGGHTEFTEAVKRPIGIATMLAFGDKESILLTENISLGDKIVLIGSAGIEGTGILAHELEEELKTFFHLEFIERAKSFTEDIDISKEAYISAKCGAKKLHDVTEGGIMGALWEMFHGKNLSSKIFKDEIHIKDETEKMCKHYDIDPYKLIGSGALIVVISEENIDKLKSELSETSKEINIIGEIIEADNPIVVSDETYLLEENFSDELYKLIW